MRIALVVERFADSPGGVEQVVRAVARELARGGDDVHVIAREGDALPGVSLERVAVPRFWQPLRVRRFSKAAKQRVLAGDFDVVHSFCRSERQDVFHAGGGSHWHYMQNTYGPTGAALRRFSPRHATLLALEQGVFADPDTIIQCVSKRVRDELAARFDLSLERMPIVYNGVDVSRFDDPALQGERDRIRGELDAKDRTVWLFCGSGFRRKGLDTALAALAESRDPNALLWVAGADSLAPWLRLAAERGVERRVRFLGARTDMPQLYAAADAFLLPSRYDGFALVALEAAAAGLPVVIGEAAGAAELFEDAGVVVREADRDTGYARALRRLADPATRARKASACRDVAVRFDWPKQVEQLRSLYERVAAR